MENWKKIFNRFNFSFRSSIEEDVKRRNIGKLENIKSTSKRIRNFKDNNSPVKY
jgi:hypothetical protein